MYNPGMPQEPAGVHMAPAVGVAASSQWSSGLFDCFNDCDVCVLTYCCPCITLGRVAEIVDRGATACGTAGVLYALIAYVSAGGCQWVYSCSYRSKMRAQMGLPEAPCPDCLVHLCCEPCALCQEYRELKARGFDPVLGWGDYNADRAGGGGVAMYPPAAQGMGR